MLTAELPHIRKLRPVNCVRMRSFQMNTLIFKEMH